jgi:hypothetical protein
VVGRPVEVQREPGQRVGGLTGRPAVRRVCHHGGARSKRGATRPWGFPTRRSRANEVMGRVGSRNRNERCEYTTSVVQKRNAREVAHWPSRGP